MTAGYSKTPLAEKLGIKENFRILLYNPPEYYFDLFSDLPSGLQEINSIKTESADFIHLFCTYLEELERITVDYKTVLKKTGLLWISWPKGSSSIKTDLKRDIIREFLIERGLVDVKVAAINEDWSGLKFVYRLKDR